tara:strand:- start:391 stop:795 length:405 start_codon:yes stop_codon:yes gene_type:complete
MKNIIYLILLVLPLTISSQEKETVLPTVDSKTFVWKAGNGEFVDVEFQYFVEDETIEQEVLKQVVMNVMVQAKFKLKIRNSFMPKRLTIMKGSSGFTAVCKYTGKNAYGTDLETSSYFSFVNEGDGTVTHMFSN